MWENSIDVAEVKIKFTHSRKKLAGKYRIKDSSLHVDSESEHTFINRALDDKCKHTGMNRRTILHAYWIPNWEYNKKITYI